MNENIIQIHVPSRSRLDFYYTITIVKDPPRAWCNCAGYRSRKYCEHMKFYKSLIRSIIHENPGVTAEKQCSKPPFLEYCELCRHFIWDHKKHEAWCKLKQEYVNQIRACEHYEDP